MLSRAGGAKTPFASARRGVWTAEVKALGPENVRAISSMTQERIRHRDIPNLDHGPTVEGCKRAIDAGYEFIHIDISQANHDASDEEIIAKRAKWLSMRSLRRSG